VEIVDGEIFLAKGSGGVWDVGLFEGHLREGGLFVLRLIVSLLNLKEFELSLEFLDV
jgi:hypothetical protein